MRWRQDFIRSLARRNGDLIVIPDLDQIFAERGRPTAVVTPLQSSARTSIPCVSRSS
jgi:purine-binding chemotaxis protein CheW